MPPDFRRRLQALVRTDRQPIRAEAPTSTGDDKVAVFRLYDPIDSWGGYWGTSAKEFATALDELPDTIEEIQLHINSPGGDVFEGIAILNALRSHDARVVAIVDGLAASAASFIAAGADECVMARNSELMIHDAWGFCVGNAADMRDLADLLDHLSDNIASIYAAKAGGDTANWRAAMAAETWYSADEAVDAGLADRIDGATTTDDAKNRFDLSIFNYAGRSQAPGPQHPTGDPAGGPSKRERGPAVAFTDEQVAHLRQQLGLGDGDDEAAIVAAFDELVDKYVDPDKASPPPAPGALPAGVVAIDQAALQELRDAASDGVAARQRQERDDRDRFLAEAMKAGKFPPARLASWQAMWDKDPEGTRDYIDKTLAAGTVPVTEIGHAGEGDADPEAAAFAANRANRFRGRRRQTQEA